jgi:4'-phosphopantetheinyl transferase
MLLIAYTDITFSAASTLISTFATGEDYRAVERFRAERRRAQSLTARALMRALLERATGRQGASWTITHDGDGKPIVSGPKDGTTIQVTLSHSRNLAVCAIADIGPIGIDVEYCAPSRPLAEIAATAFGPGERQLVDRLGASAFYRIWTLREALAKACGSGFSMLVNGIDYFPEAPSAGIWTMPINDQEWLFSCRSLPGNYATAAALGPRLRLDSAATELGEAMSNLDGWSRLLS